MVNPNFLPQNSILTVST